MNSKLLEEAIVDAEALREAALKSAEQAILEKYAPEIKTAIETLLEQDAQDMAGGAMPPLGADISAQKSSLDAPLAATDGENLCPCPDEEEVITISIGDLEKAISDLARANKQAQEEPEEMAMPMDMPVEQPPAEEAAPEEMPPEEEEEAAITLEEEIEIDDNLIASILAESDDIELEEMSQEEIAALEEPENKIDKKDLKALRDKKHKTNESKVISLKNSTMLVENKKVLNENKLLTEKLSKLLEQHNKILEENKKVKQTAIEISQRLEETNLLNAKLLYKNQALGSDSLNERQKQKIVEAVSKAGSVDEVKMIYDTLCNAVGTFDTKGPQSLSEAVEKKGGLTLKPRQEKNSNINPVYNKWQKIAGIKK